MGFGLGLGYGYGCERALTIVNELAPKFLGLVVGGLLVVGVTVGDGDGGRGVGGGGLVLGRRGPPFWTRLVPFQRWLCLLLSLDQEAHHVALRQLHVLLGSVRARVRVRVGVTARIRARSRARARIRARARVRVRVRVRVRGGG